MRNVRFVAAATLTVLVFGSSFAPAAMFVSPAANTVLPGTAQGPTPLRFFGAGGSRNQIEYPASDFLALAGPQNITSITFRPFPGSAPSGFIGGTVTASNVIITLSSTTRTDEAGLNPLSATYANNVGTDVKTVYSGALTLTTTATDAPGGATKVFDYNIALQTSFTFNPLAGRNLLLDVNIPADATVSGTGFGFLTFDNANNAGDGVASVVNVSDGAATTGSVGTDGPITRFTTTAVPEPTTLVALGLGGVAVRRRRRA